MTAYFKSASHIYAPFSSMATWQNGKLQPFISLNQSKHHCSTLSITCTLFKLASEVGPCTKCDDTNCIVLMMHHPVKKPLFAFLQEKKKQTVTFDVKKNNLCKAIPSKYTLAACTRNNVHSNHKITGVQDTKFIQNIKSQRVQAKKFILNIKKS